MSELIRKRTCSQRRHAAQLFETPRNKEGQADKNGKQEKLDEACKDRFEQMIVDIICRGTSSECNYRYTLSKENVDMKSYSNQFHVRLSTCTYCCNTI